MRDQLTPEQREVAYSALSHLNASYLYELGEESDSACQAEIQEKLDTLQSVLALLERHAQPEEDHAMYYCSYCHGEVDELDSGDTCKKCAAHLIEERASNNAATEALMRQYYANLERNRTSTHCG